MRYLFLFISFLYSFIFFVIYTITKNKDVFLQYTNNNVFSIKNLSIFDSIVFSKGDDLIFQSFFGNVLIDSIIFFVIGIVLFIYFSNIKIKAKKEDKKGKKVKNEEYINIFSYENFVKFLKKFSYYIGFILFYLSAYIISKSFGFFSFSLLILFINIIVYLFYFLSKFSNLSKDFLKINSILFSLFYIVSYILIFITKNNFFNSIDFLNSFLIIITFPVLMYFDKKINKKESFDDTIIIHLSVYIFFVFLFYLYSYVFNHNIMFWSSFISTVFGIIWFEKLPKIKFFKNNKIILKYIGIFFMYFGSLLGVIYLIRDFSFFITLILIIQIAYHYFVHKKYNNYISFSLSLFLLIFLFYYFIIKFDILSIKSVAFFIISIIFSFGLVGYSYIEKFKLNIDYFIIHCFSYIINIISIILFFVFNNFDILYIGILLFIESIYFFLSYNKLKSK